MEHNIFFGIHHSVSQFVGMKPTRFSIFKSNLLLRDCSQLETIYLEVFSKPICFCAFVLIFFLYRLTKRLASSLLQLYFSFGVSAESVNLPCSGVPQDAILPTWRYSLLVILLSKGGINGLSGIVFWLHIFQKMFTFYLLFCYSLFFKTNAALNASYHFGGLQ